jgi:hypothetical protein
MTDTINRHNDWSVTSRHLEIVDNLKPAGLRPAQIWQTIPGVVGKRINADLREGIFLMPLGSEIGNTYSSVHDVNRKSLLVAAIGRSTSQSNGPPVLMQLAESVRTAFANTRVAEMLGELYSSHEIAGYDIDDALARKLDVIQIILVSRFRETR